MASTSSKLSPPKRLALAAGPLRLVVSFIVPAVAFLVLRWSFIFMRDADANKVLIAVVALVFGVGAVWALYLLTTTWWDFFPVDYAISYAHSCSWGRQWSSWVSTCSTRPSVPSS